MFNKELMKSGFGRNKEEEVKKTHGKKKLPKNSGCGY